MTARASFHARVMALPAKGMYYSAFVVRDDVLPIAAEADTLLAAAEGMRVALLAAQKALADCLDDSREAVNAYIINYGEKWRPHRLAALRETVSTGEAALAATGAALAAFDRASGETAA